MPRRNSSNASVADQFTAIRWQDINEDLDDIYSNGSDRLHVTSAISGTALKIDIGAGTARVGTTDVQYAGAVGISVTNTATNYVQIDSSGTIQINTTAWVTTYTNLAVVVCSGGVITSISNWKMDAAGGDFGNIPTGFMMMWPVKVAPSNTLLCYGQAVSRSTYAALFAVMVPSLGTFTVTIATPAVFSLTSHLLVAGDPVYFTTTGALPTGLSVNTIYYVIAAGLTANAFEVSATRGGAAINTSGSQSGTHTLRYCPHGLGDGSTTFNIPDMRGRVPVGWDLMGGGSATARVTSPTGSNVSETAAGEENHTLSIAEMPSHNHTLSKPWISSPTGSGRTAFEDAAGTTATSSTGGGGAHNNMQPYLTVSYIIKT